MELIPAEILRKTVGIVGAISSGIIEEIPEGNLEKKALEQSLEEPLKISPDKPEDYETRN